MKVVRDLINAIAIHLDGDLASFIVNGDNIRATIIDDFDTLISNATWTFAETMLERTRHWDCFYALQAVDVVVSAAESCSKMLAHDAVGTFISRFTHIVYSLLQFKICRWTRARVLAEISDVEGLVDLDLAQLVSPKPMVDGTLKQFVL
jgi:hypothetical protein